MTTTKSKLEERWVWCPYNGRDTLQRVEVSYCSNSIEQWYEDANHYTYDPFYVEVDRDVLLKKVQDKATGEIESAQSRLDHWTKVLKGIAE